MTDGRRRVALQGGYRFPVPMSEVFPHGVYALSVEQAEDYDEKTGRRSPSKDKQSGSLVWTVTCIDRDPEARAKEVKVKVTAPVQPVLPEEVLPGSGLRMVDFGGLTITPYVNEGRGRARLAYSYRATGVFPQGKAPTSTSTPTTGSGASRAGGLASSGAPGQSGDGKAA